MKVIELAELTSLWCSDSLWACLLSDIRIKNILYWTKI